MPVKEEGALTKTFLPLTLPWSSRQNVRCPASTAWPRLQDQRVGGCLLIARRNLFFERVPFLAVDGCAIVAQVMVISLGAGTHVFQLDKALGEFVLTKRGIRMPARGRCGVVRWSHLTALGLWSTSPLFRPLRIFVSRAACSIQRDFVAANRAGSWRAVSRVRYDCRRAILGRMYPHFP